MTTKKEQKKLDRRMLAVEDPVEMKTEEGTEILVAATPEEIAADNAALEEEDDRRPHSETPGGSLRRRGNVHIRGIGEVS